MGVRAVAQMSGVLNHGGPFGSEGARIAGQSNVTKCVNARSNLSAAVSAMRAESPAT
jgi:hypothetical protein